MTSSESLSEEADIGAIFDALVAAGNSSMVVVAASDGSETDACLVGFHCQCSIEPRRYAIWLSKANHTHRIAKRSQHLAVHWLAPGDRDLAVAAGTVTLDDDPSKMHRIPWHAGPHGAPVLDGAAAGVVGRIEHRHDDGDHVCFVVTPVAAWGREVSEVLRFADVRDLAAGHPAEDPPAG